MDTNETRHEPDQQTAGDPDATQAPAPRGNPATDHESVQKGEEQLDKISGN